MEIVRIFRQSISKIDGEITAARFVEEKSEKTDVNLKLLTDESVLSCYRLFFHNMIKEIQENLTLESMETLNKPNTRTGMFIK